MKIKNAWIFLFLFLAVTVGIGVAFQGCGSSKSGNPTIYGTTN
jgi:hypothetical protein